MLAPATTAQAKSTHLPAAAPVTSAGPANQGFLAAPAKEEDGKRVLIYTGTTGYRHAEAIDNGRPVVQAALKAAGYEVDWEDCDNNGGGTNNCDNPNKNPRIFTDDNLARYSAILFLNASWSWAGGGRTGPLLDQAQRDALIRFTQNRGGIAAVHNMTDAGAGASVWDWWDGGPDSVIGTTMTAHSNGSATGNAATVQVADHNHLSTKDLPDTYQLADEHYNFVRSVRGTHHVLETFDERTYNTGSQKMGQDHPTTWCKLYDGDRVKDGTATPRSYNDGRTWVTSQGHFGVRYSENGGDNPLVKQIVGGVRWVAGEGNKTDCSGTVWSNFTRTTLVDNANGPMALDVAADGKLYWTEIGPTTGYQSQGYVKMHDPNGPPNNSTTVATIPTRADHGNSEDGVLGMSLEPGFDLSNPNKRDIYVYYSPRNPDWPTTGNQQTVGYNLISRFTLNEAGTAFVPAPAGGAADPAHPYDERQILRVPKAKISGNPSGFPGGPTDNGPGHVGGASLVFDSEGNLYLGVGDDTSPNAPGHNGYPPMDHRASERWDARKTAANTADLRGKILRIKPIEDIPPPVSGSAPDPGLDKTYTVPKGNMFPPGTPKTRPEIYAMGFRQPFTVHTDPANPGTVVVGEYCHDNTVDQANRAPAGTCEWDLVDEPGFQGWPFCVGDNSKTNTTWRWNYETNSSTGQQYDCSLDKIPADLAWAPPGGKNSQPTFQGLDEIPGPAKSATIWRKYPGNPGGQDPMAFGDLGPGGMQPVTGPVYRYKDSYGPGAFPPYYDGSWLITNRGADNGFWKEVRLREDNNQMLRVNDWLPVNHFGTPNSSFVIPTRFGPDGALYMGRWTFGCCRNQINSTMKMELVKIEFKPSTTCAEDTQAPTVSHQIEGRAHPSQQNTYIDSATLKLTANDVGCAGVEKTEYRVNGGAWTAYDAPVPFKSPGKYTVDYRATDYSGNTSNPQSAVFTVLDGGRTLPTTCDIFASGTGWSPGNCEITRGGTVTWHFNVPDAGMPHDVWLVPPGGNPDPNGGDIFEVTKGAVSPGGPPVSYTFDREGTWTVICRLHSGFDGKKWAGMVATVTVGGGAKGVYTIAPKHSGKYVTPQDASTADDAKIVQMSATEGSEQQWEAIPFTAGAYQLKNVKSGKCLDVPAGSTATGTQLVQYSCHPDGHKDQVNQRFYLIPSGDAYQVNSAVSGLCLDINGNSKADGAALIQWTCSNADNQRFGFTPVSSPGVPLTVTASSRCVGTSAYVAVTAVNDGDAPATIELNTPFGTKTVADVAPGKQAYQSFNARAGQIGAGKVTVKGTATIGGKQVTSTYDAAYNAISCA
ncbi:ThuA domain-containing protein [Microbispora sp. NPDC088329]|uniref:ThuA domain-containing protein n=1 Tax=Microbispora sp. NPDC088329 TaxID=3154869 RepID=UPI00343BBE8E